MQIIWIRSSISAEAGKLNIEGGCNFTNYGNAFHNSIYTTNIKEKMVIARK